MIKKLLILLILFIVSNNVSAQPIKDGFYIGTGMDFKFVGDTKNNIDKYFGYPNTSQGFKTANEYMQSLFLAPFIRIGYTKFIGDSFLITPETQIDLGDTHTKIYKIKFGYHIKDTNFIINLGLGAEVHKKTIDSGRSLYGKDVRPIVEPELLYIINNKNYVHYSVRFGDETQIDYYNSFMQQMERVNYNIVGFSVGYTFIF